MRVFSRNLSVLDLCCGVRVGYNRLLYHSSNRGDLLRGKAVSMESRWMLKCFF